jgi:hypothetical protein
VALAIQTLLDIRLGRPTSADSPWRAGRFATEGSRARDETESLGDTAVDPDLPEAGLVIRGLRHGVVAHTAKLPTDLRRLIEAEFRSRDSILRVLVATDTLAVGVNLPADCVVATSLSGYSGSPRRRRLLRPEDLENKAGRAGRRGQSSRHRGEFFILVPTERELQENEDLSVADTKALSTIGGVFDRYVRPAPSDVTIRSHFTTLDEIAGLVLLVLCQDGFSRTRNNLLARIVAILSGALMSQDDTAEPPSAEEILDHLLSSQLLGSRQEKIKVSDLGLAVARSGLGLASADSLERIARLACDGAGDIDLLWNAARSAIVQAASDWILLPPVGARHMPSLKDAVLALGHAYASPDIQRRRYCAQLVGLNARSAGGTKSYGPVEELVEAGSAIVTPELVDLLETPGDEADLVEINALLRALIAYEWSRGVPFAQLKARFSKSIRSDEIRRGERPIELKVFYSDVEQICEQIASLLNSASSLAFVPNGPDFSARVRSLAISADAGLPNWLAPIARMRIPGLGRERLASLWDVEPPEDSLADIVDLEPLASRRGFTPEIKEDARHRIGVREQELESIKGRIAQKWSAVLVPDLSGDTFEDLSQDLEEAETSDAYLTGLQRLLLASGLELREKTQNNFFMSAVLVSEELELSVHVPHGDVDAASVDFISDAGGLVVLRRRITPAGTQRLGEGAHVTRFVQPEHLLSMLASLVDARGEGLTGAETIEHLRRIRVSSLDDEGWFLQPLDGLSAPPPFDGPVPPLDERIPVVPADEEL